GRYPGRAAAGRGAGRGPLHPSGCRGIGFSRRELSGSVHPLSSACRPVPRAQRVGRICSGSFMQTFASRRRCQHVSPERKALRPVMHNCATGTRSITMKNPSSKSPDLKRVRSAALATPTDLAAAATRDITGALNALLADTFALYMKTKNFHWHMSGPHFRDYHLLLDEQADQIYAITDPIAERVRKLGGETVKSIGHIARLQRVLDNDAEY